MVRAQNQSRRARSRWRSVLFAVVTSSLATLIVLELILQVATGNLGMPRYDIHPADGRCVGLSPGTAVGYTGWALRVPEVTHDVNRLGYRGDVRERDKPADVFRILMIGDSFTYGQAVAADQTMAAHLEHALREQSKSKIEVLNFGVPGLNAEESIDQYRKFASQWQHDLVLLAASGNDLGPPICNLVSKPRTASLIKSIRLARLIYFFAIHPFDERDARSGRPQERLESVIDGFMETSHEHQARFGLVMLQNTGFDGAGDVRLDPVAGARSLPFFALEGSGSTAASAIARIPGEFHFSPEGNREAAIRIAAWLKESKLLPAQ